MSLDFQICLYRSDQSRLRFVFGLQSPEDLLVDGTVRHNVLHDHGFFGLALSPEPCYGLGIELQGPCEAKPDDGVAAGLKIEAVSGRGRVDQGYRDLAIIPSADTVGFIQLASWGCATRITNGRQACDTHHINETVLEATYLAALRDLLDNASDVVEAVKEGAELALEPENRAAIERVEAEIVGIQEAVLELHRAKQRMELGAAEYTAKVKEYSELMKAKEAERDALQDTAVKYTEVKTWLDTFMDQIMQSTSLTKVDGTTMKMLVEKIIARDTGIEVIFKCGVSVEHEYVK